MKPAGITLWGLTGGIACGKSVVLSMLAELGAHVIDADEVTRQLQEPGRPVYNGIVKTFGPEYLQYPDGPLDRARLGARVFSDPEQLERLELIVHPAVRGEVFGWLEQIAAQSNTPQVAVLDAIKLLEGGWKTHCDAIWVVVCTPEQQLERLIRKRGMSEHEARQRIAAQPSQEARLEHADVIIDNSDMLDETRLQIETAWYNLTQQIR